MLLLPTPVRQVWDLLYVQQASYLERGPLMWMMPLHLHVNLKSDYDMIWYETTSSQKISCRTHKGLTASFLATGGFVKLFHKIPWFFYDYSGFFKFHDFSMHGTFLKWFSRFSMISRACGNPVSCFLLRKGELFASLYNSFYECVFVTVCVLRFIPCSAMWVNH